MGVRSPQSTLFYLQQQRPLALGLDGQGAGAEGDDDVLRTSHHALVISHSQSGGEQIGFLGCVRRIHSNDITVPGVALIGSDSSMS